MTHVEIVKKRSAKSSKKRTQNRKKNLIKEYLKLDVPAAKSKESTATSIMNIVEDINENGMNDKRYLDIMNQLMRLHKEECDEDEEREEEPDEEDAAAAVYRFEAWRQFENASELFARENLYTEPTPEPTPEPFSPRTLQLVRDMARADAVLNAW